MQALLIDNMEVQIDGKKISSMAVEDTVQVENTPGNQADIDSVMIENIRSIADFRTSRVIALGKSIHGNGSIEHCAFETIKHLIREENCRLVMFEIGFELGLWLNEYVNGEVLKEDLLKRMVGYNLDFNGLIDLLNWIKAYNIRNSGKVMCLGMDMNIIFFNISGFNHLNDLIKTWNLNQDSVRPFYDFCTEDKFKEAEDYFLKSNCFKNIEASKRSCILRALELRQQQRNFNPFLLCDPNSSLIEGDRDLILFHNVKFAVDNFLRGQEKAVIFAHLGHINKLNIFGGRLYIPSLGNYLSKCYNNRYFSIALLAGEDGTYSNTDPQGNFSSALPLVPPIKGSIENLFMALNDPFIYKKTSGLEATLCGRDIGMFYTMDQFYPYCMKSRVDAVMFLKQAKGYELPSNWPKTLKEMEHYIDELRIMNGHKKFF